MQICKGNLVFTAALLQKSEICHLSHFDKIKQNQFLNKNKETLVWFLFVSDMHLMVLTYPAEYKNLTGQQISSHLHDIENVNHAKLKLVQ